MLYYLLLIENQRLEKALQFNQKKDSFGQTQVIQLLNLLETYILLDADTIEYNQLNLICHKEEKYDKFSSLFSKTLENINDYFHAIDLSSSVNFNFLKDIHESIKKINEQVRDREKDLGQHCFVISQCLEKLSFSLFQLSQDINSVSFSDFLQLSQHDQQCDFIHCDETSFQKFSEIVHQRKSVRNFLDIDVNIDLIEKSILLCEKIPSACNRKTHEVFLIKDKSLQDMIMKDHPGTNNISAPLLAIITIDEKAFFQKHEASYPSLHAGLFSAYFSLALTSFGLGTCFINWNVSDDKNKEVEELLKIHFKDFHTKIHLLMWIGYEQPTFLPYKIPHQRKVEEILKLI